MPLRANATALAAASLFFPLGSIALAQSDSPAPGADKPVAAEQQLPAVTVAAPAEAPQSAGYVARNATTATKSSTPIIETPQSISVITREEMEAQGVQNVSEAVRYTAGATSEIYGSDPRTDWIKLRGFTAPDFLDGLALPRGTYAWGKTDPYMLDSIEVVRGPSSGLYGQTPPGGLINMTSKRPTMEPVREIQLQAGHPERWQGALDLGGPIGDGERFAYRFVALGRAGETQVDHVNDDRVMVAPSFTWNLSRDTSLTLLAHYMRSKSKSLQFLPAYGTLFGNPNGTISRGTFLGNTDWDDYTHEQKAVGYAFSHRFNPDVTFRQNLRLAEVDYDLQVVRGFGFAAGSLRNVNTRPVAIHDRVRGIALDNQLEYKVQTGPVAHTLLAGIDYQDQTADYTFGTGTLRAIDIYNPVNTPIGSINTTTSTKQSVRQLGFYLQEQARIGRLTLLATGRHDSLRGTSTNRLNNVDTQLDDSAMTGRVGAIYNFDSGFAPYVSYSSSFQPNVGVDYTGGALKPTTGKQFEAGVKYQPRSWQRSLVTLAVYDLRQNDIVAYNAALLGNQQTGKVRVKGVELEGRANLFGGLDALASVTYTHSEVEQSVNARAIGKALPQTPKMAASTWLNYRFSDPTLLGLSMGVGVRYIGSTYANDINSLKVPSVTLVDAALRYELGKLHPTLKTTSLALNIANLFDREYVAGCNDLNSCYWGSGRVTRLTLTSRF